MSVGAVNKQTGDRIPTAGMTVVDSVLSGSSTNPVQNRVVKAALDEKADTDIVASEFDATESYTAGKYCIYEGKFYKFKNNHSGAWSAADVDEIKIAGELSSLMSGLIKKSHYTLTTDTDGDVSINVSVGNIVAIIPDRSRGDDGCYTSWFTGLVSTNTQGTFYSIKFVDATLAKIASTKMAFDVLYT